MVEHRYISKALPVFIGAAICRRKIRDMPTAWASTKKKYLATAMLFVLFVALSVRFAANKPLTK